MSLLYRFQVVRGLVYLSLHGGSFDSCNVAHGRECTLGNSSKLLDHTCQRDTVFCLRREESAVSERFKQPCSPTRT